MDSTSPAPGRPGTRANVGRVAAFVVVLALTAAGGWQVGRFLGSSPPEPAAVTTSVPAGP